MKNDAPINIEMFNSPHIARIRTYARKGILNPTEETLHPDRYRHLYRLGHSSLSHEENLSSPWWSDFQALQAMRRFAEINQISLTVSGRIGNAQAPEFGPADILYMATISGPIRTFRGLGRPILSGGRIYAPPHSITQTYVPGLRAWPNKSLSAIGRSIIENWTSSLVPKGAITIYGE